MFIQNVSLKDTRDGFHYDAGPNSVLIQIVDPGHPFPVPKYQFSEIHQFEFLDVEFDDRTPAWDFRPTQEQADQIVEILANAIKKRANVIVHCHAGLCRSGAVCEVGVIMGMCDTETRRTPNTLLKRMMMKTLGLDYGNDTEFRSKYSYLFDDFN